MRGIVIAPITGQTARVARLILANIAVVVNPIGRIVPGDIKEVDGDWTISGPKGYVCVCVGQSDDLEGAKLEAYRLVDDVIVPNRMVRFDIGEHIPWQISSLKSLLEQVKEEVEVP